MEIFVEIKYYSEEFKYKGKEINLYDLNVDYKIKLNVWFGVEWVLVCIGILKKILKIRSREK